MSQITILILGLFIAFCTSLACGGGSGGNSTPHAAGYQFVREWGKFGDQGILSYPFGITLSPNGTVLVTDRGKHRVQEFSEQLVYRAKIDLSPEGTPYFSYPRKLAITRDGSLYVADDTDKVQAFDANGVYQGSWGGSDQMSTISGLAVDSAGNLYVAYGPTCQIRKFTPQGVLLALWGMKGPGDDQFTSLTELVIDTADRLYICDAGKNRIVRFDANGAYLGFLPMEDSPLSVAVDDSDHIFVGFNNCVRKYDLVGTLLAQWGSYGTAEGAFSGVEGIVIAPDGSIVTVDFSNSRIQKFDGNGRYLGRNTCLETGIFCGSAHISGEEPSSLFTADPGSNRMQAFDTSGTFMFELKGSAVLRTATGSYLALDKSVNQIVEVTRDGSPISIWGTYASTGVEAGGKLFIPLDLYRGRDGNIYVLDFYWEPLNKKNYYRIQKFLPDGTFVKMLWEGMTYIGGINSAPGGFYVDDRVYVSEGYNCLVRILDTEGTQLASFGARGSGAGEFLQPAGLCADTSGRIYVCDSGNNRIQVFDNEGAFLAEWGEPGSAPGQFESPLDITIDSGGTIYIFDGNNYRVQVFEESTRQ